VKERASATSASTEPAGLAGPPVRFEWRMAGKIEIDPIITHTLTLDEINKGFDLMHEGKGIRSVVVY
jgi:S-(hydroxymethyl)glutathione dehydrogenase/alcohol dehydrogenase